eukprot:UN4575
MSRTASISSSEDDTILPKLKASAAAAGEGHMLKDMQNLDPKAVFANERTLLHYAEKGLYSGALAVVLLHLQGSSQIAGGLLAVATMLYYLWALQEYYGRLQRITGRAAVAKDKLRLRLDVAHGPVIVLVLVGLVLLLTAAITVWEPKRHVANP